jgi:UMP-CMP kinase
MASRTAFSSSWRRLAARFNRHSTVAPSSPFASKPFRQHRFISSQPPRNTNQIKFWPFLVIVGLGTFGYTQLVKRRIGEIITPAPPPFHQVV